MMTIEKKTATIQYSRYQQAIFDAVAAGEKALVVAACPGSGKTTTSKELIRFLPADSSVLALAFNHDAAAQLGAKIKDMLSEMIAAGQSAPRVDSRTIHSLGNATLTTAGLKSSVKTNKYRNLCRDYFKERDIAAPGIVPNLAKLIDMIRLTLSTTDEKSLIKLINRFEIDLDPDDAEIWPIILSAVPAILKAGIAQCQYDKVIDYTDMIWLPEVLNLQPKRYDYVLVDEAQDLSPAQRALALKARKSNGAFIAVGDRRQAIYGFAGASLRSIDEIIEATGARELPLSICYRCPTTVVDLAASIYPGIEPAPGAPAGIVEHITPDKVEMLVQPGDLILCRLTAPLVEMCLSLLRQGKRATVRGRDLGATFTALLEQVQKFQGNKHPLTMHNLTESVRNYLTRQIEILSLHAEDNELKISSLEDKIDTLLALHEAYAAQAGRHSIEGFMAYITDFFKEDKDAQIVLSTGHRAKGLEYPRVFILQSDKLPHPKARTPEALTQEYNLMYVMYTRAMQALYLVVTHLPAKPEQEDEAPTIALSPASAETPAPGIEVPQQEETMLVTEEAKAAKHGGGRPAKDRKRVNIKLDSALEQMTSAEGLEARGIDIDRSELINRLLWKFFTGTDALEALTCEVEDE
jgi:DNA helicase-2/ATP-dependent DNA helicase PcrA